MEWQRYMPSSTRKGRWESGATNVRTVNRSTGAGGTRSRVIVAAPSMTRAKRLPKPNTSTA